MKDTDGIIVNINKVLSILKEHEFIEVEMYRSFTASNILIVSLIAESKISVGGGVNDMKSVVEALLAEKELKDLVGHEVSIGLKESCIISNPNRKSIKLKTDERAPGNFSQKALEIFNAPAPTRMGLWHRVEKQEEGSDLDPEIKIAFF